MKANLFLWLFSGFFDNHVRHRCGRLRFRLGFNLFHWLRIDRTPATSGQFGFDGFVIIVKLFAASSNLDLESII